MSPPLPEPTAGSNRLRPAEPRPRPRRRPNPALLTAAATAASLSLLAQRTGAQTAVWLGGVGNWSTAAKWSTGVVPNSGTTSVWIDNGNAATSNVTLDITAAVNNFTLDAGDSFTFSSGNSPFSGNNLTITGDAIINGNLDNHAGKTIFFQGTNAQTLGGHGQITFDQGIVAIATIYQNSTNALTIGPDILIHGRHGVLVDQSGAGFLNRGTISADVAGFGLGGFSLFDVTNTGTIEALSGNTIFMLDRWHNAGTIRVGSNSFLDLRGTFTPGDIGTVSLDPAGTAFITGLLDCTGSTFTLDPHAGTWVLQDGTVHGGVVIATSGNTFAINSGTLDSVTLNVGADGTDGGVLNLGSGSLSWHNLGTINGTNVTFNFGGNFSQSDLATINRFGTSVLNLTGLLDNVGHTFNLGSSASDAWTLAGGTIRGGTIVSTGAAGLLVNGGTLDSVTLDAQVRLSANAQLSVMNGLTLTNNALLDLANGTNGSSSALQFSGTATQSLGGAGVISFGTSGAGSTLSNQSTNALTIAAGVLVHGKNGTLNGLAVSAAGILNQGTIAADVAGGTLTLIGVSNAAHIQAMNGGNIATTAFVNLPSGTIDVSNASLSLGSGTSSWHNLGIINGTNATFNLGGVFSQADIGLISRSGTTAVNLVGTLNNDGQTLNLDPGLLGTWNMLGGTIHGGTVSASGGAQLLATDGTLDGATLSNIPVQVNGALRLAGMWHNGGAISGASNSTIDLGGSFSTADIGTIACPASGTVTISGSLDNRNTTLTLDGVAGALVLSNTGNISGGTIRRTALPLLLATGGTLDSVTLDSTTLSFSSAAATLTIQNGLTLVGGASIDLANGSNGFSSTIYFTGTNAETLGGNGEVTFGLSGAGSALQSISSGTNALTIGPSIFIHGKNGTLQGTGSNATGGILNQGSIVAEVSAGTINLNSVSNAATVQGINGGSIASTAFNNLPSGTVTISGGGNLTLNAFTNSGAINIDGGVLNLGSSTFAWHNFGTINATNTTLNLGGHFVQADIGTLNHSGTIRTSLTGTLDNGGQTLSLDPATLGSWTMQGGTIHAGTVIASGGAKLLVNTGTLDGVTLGPDVLAFNSAGASLTVLNGLKLADGSLLDLQRGTNRFATTIYFTGPNAQSLDGKTEIVFGDNSYGFAFRHTTLFNFNNTNVLAIGPDVFIHGGPGQMLGDAPFLLKGTISADISDSKIEVNNFTNLGTLQAINNGILHLGGTWHNAGTIRVTGSTLELDGSFQNSDIASLIRGPGSTLSLVGVLDNTGAILDLDVLGPIITGPTIPGVSPATIRGGTVISTVTNPLLFGKGGGLDGVTLRGSAAFNGLGVETRPLSVLNGLTLDSGASIQLSVGNTIAFGGTNAQTLGGNGQLNAINPSGYAKIQNTTGSPPVTLGPNILIHGQSIQFGTLFTNKIPTGGFLNQGTVSVDVAGSTLDFQIAFTNQATVQALSGAGIRLDGPRFVQTSGVLRSPGDVPNAGLLQISGGSASLGSLSGTGSTILGNIAPGALVPCTLNSFSQSSLTIHNTGVLTINPSPTRLTSPAPSVSIDGAGTLDLANAELLTSTSPAMIKSYLASAYTPSQDWSGPGLTSTVAKTNPTNYSLAYASGSDPSAQDAAIKLHDGSPLPTNQTVVRVTLTGDANLDGTVDFFDITQLLGYKYNTGQPASYTDGDLNYDGVVDFFDLTTLLSANYNSGQTYLGSAAQPGAQPSSATATPEPALIALPLALASAALRRRRRPAPK
jgi:hypothetical protein